MKTLAPSDATFAAEAAAAFAPPLAPPMVLPPPIEFDAFLTRATTVTPADDGAQQSTDASAPVDDEETRPARADASATRSNADDASAATASTGSTQHRDQADETRDAPPTKDTQSTQSAHDASKATDSSSTSTASTDSSTTRPNGSASDGTSAPTTTTPTGGPPATATPDGTIATADGSTATNGATATTAKAAAPALDSGAQGRVDVVSTSAPANVLPGAAGPSTTATSTAANAANVPVAPTGPTASATAPAAVGGALANGTQANGDGSATAHDGKSSSGTGTPKGTVPVKAATADNHLVNQIDAAAERTSSSTDGSAGTPTFTTGPAATAASAPTTTASATNAVASAAGAQGPAQTAAVDGTDTASSAAPAAPVAEQVLDAVLPIRDHADGDYNVKLELRPADLGRVELTVALHDGVLSVHMHADSATTRDALQDQLGKMRDMLQERGVRTGSLDVGDNSDHATAHEGDEDARNGSPKESESTLVPAAVQRSAGTTPSTSTSGRLDLHV